MTMLALAGRLVLKSVRRLASAQSVYAMCGRLPFRVVLPLGRIHQR